MKSFFILFCLFLTSQILNAKDEVYTTFDLETTGLSSKSDRIIEVAVVKFSGTNIISKKSWLINPQMTISPKATSVHGITDKMVKDSPKFKEIYNDFLNEIKGTTLIAHNALFDIRFMQAEIKRNNLVNIHPLTIDSLTLSRELLDIKSGYSLKSIAEYLQIKSDLYHRAGADAEILAEIFIKLKEMFPHNKFQNAVRKSYKQF